MKVQIDITQAMIDTGVKCSPRYCPTAKGFQAAGYPFASVNGVTVLLLRYAPDATLDEKVAAYAALPKEINLWILRFDRGDKQEPISFEIDLPIPPQTSPT